jgi:hypothetical protein
MVAKEVAPDVASHIPEVAVAPAIMMMSRAVNLAVRFLPARSSAHAIAATSIPPVAAIVH